ncbi:MAG TPA: GGDEF domain-containing protein [Candidatus Paceibacterota bacterium]|nr:GGDEF domain-containing protein [Candidatus Paceibacterota bacterium]
MNGKKPIQARDLKHALYDGARRLREVLREETFAFDGEGSTADTEELQNEIERLKQLVHKDELTGVLNRRGIREDLERFFKEALYAKSHPEHRTNIIINDFSVIFFDIDDFKRVNDMYGHDEGDRILKAVADTLTRHVRDLDAVGRLGGEEFVVALLGASEERAFEKGEKIRMAIAGHVHLKDGKPITVSVGVASLAHSNAETLEPLIDCADKAMYEAKHRRGKNAVVRYSELA